MSDQTFEVWGHRLPYYSHPYNETWRNERAVELPIAEAWLAALPDAGAGLEVGNVLDHYGMRPAGWRCIDLYEQADGVENVDLIGWSEPQALDAIVSISTVEHVGWDDVRCRDCAALVLSALVGSLAPPHGAMLLTVPLSWNSVLDDVLLSGGHPWQVKACTLVRDDLDQPWYQTDQLEARPYIGGGDGALSVWVGQFGAARL